jgi:pyruvate/2-oxoglutarate dehydrogenase complex dihydrolipoamide dehydrogenase (E3) component/uncharacterized membrane protein YdjX (TVP38/TMEM64 family)
LVVLFFAFDVPQYLTLDTFKSRQNDIDVFYRANPWVTGCMYFGIYVAVTALSLPGAALMTLAGGAIFGVVVGTVVVSFASTIGATLAFLVSRFLLRDWVQERFGSNFAAVNEGIRKDGPVYLFTLRLVPIFPFFVINLLMGLTPIRTLVYYVVSQIGMFPATVVYVNAGTQLAKIESLSGILSPGLLISFALLGLFPLVAKKSVEYLNSHKVLRHHSKPKRFDRNLVVIGAGSAGLVAAYIAAAVKARVTLIEKHRMGGDCLHTGCVPSKALIRAAKYVHQIQRAREYGMKSATVDYDFADIMDRVHRIIKTIEPHDSVERYTQLGVECIHGEARITSPYSVEINGNTLTTRSIVVAAGAQPLVPPIDGIDAIDFWTSDNLWQMRERPRRLLVLGCGPIGCELTQAFARLGSDVTQVEMLPRMLSKEDPEISEIIHQRFAQEGIDVRVNTTAKAVRREAGVIHLECEHQGEPVTLEGDELLVALGRRADVAGYGLEELGVTVSRAGTIQVDDYMRSTVPTIFACGDVAGPYQFTHTAAHQAWYAAVNGLFGVVKKYKVDYSVIPWATFTDPEVAHVGINEIEAKEKGIDYEVTRYDMKGLDRAITDEEAHGLVKVLTVPGKDKILGATIVGEHAGDLIAEYVAAMRHKLGLNKILGTIHVYPTLAEANKFAAGEWKRAHAPQGLLRWVERFHRWRLG